jgi:hypothetical protein
MLAAAIQGGPVKAFRSILAVLAMGAAVGCGDGYSTDPDLPTPSRVVIGSGDLTTFVAEFRTVLGDPNNGGTAGAQPAGRREINWDGVPANFTNNDDFPGDFFNTRSPRGIVCTTSGAGFRVSDNSVADVDASYGQEFAAFSPRKTFLPEGSAVTDVSFHVPGTTEAAAVRGFGVVFSDVDRQGSATVEYFGREGSLGRFEAPVRGAGSSLSFVGVAFDSKIVTRVRIVSGRAPLAAGVRDVSAGGAADLVIMDDFFYDEPQAIR